MKFSLPRATLTVYLISLAIFLLAGLFPNGRVWGINVWAYFPFWVPLVLLGFGLVVGTLLWFWSSHRRSLDVSESPVANWVYPVFSIGLIVGSGLAFYLLRSRLHFFGDGYQILSILSSDNPFIKPTERGEALIHLWISSLITGTGEMKALLSYQVVSIGCGVAFLVSTAILTRHLFQHQTRRILFLSGLASGGYMLLFFGYVENYSLLVLSVVVYCLLGMLIMQGKVKRWLLLPPLVLSVFFHVIAVTLIPSAFYLLLVGTRPGNFIAHLPRWSKLLLGTIVASFLVATFLHFYLTDYFFRFAIVPLINTRFAVEGYTLFSLKHLADCINLMVVLLPGLGIVMVTIFFVPVRKLLRRPEYTFLLILLLSSLGAVFILDPKLGMARDWDLFSFSGVPMVLLAYFLILDPRNRTPRPFMVSGLMIILGLLSLTPRVAGLTVPDVSLAHFRNHIAYDMERNRNSRILLVNYYKGIGDTTTAEVEFQRWKTDHPEEVLLKRCNELYFQERRLQETRNLFPKVLELNPVYSEAYSFMGFYYLSLKMYDTALVLIKIADGLRPNNATTLNNLGLAYSYLGDYGRAEKALLRAYDLDNTLVPAMHNLARLYRITKDKEKYRYYLAIAASADGATAAIATELGDFYVAVGEYREAAEAYRRGLTLGMDSVRIDSVLTKRPRLRDWLDWPR